MTRTSSGESTTHRSFFASRAGRCLTAASLWLTFSMPAFADAPSDLDRQTADCVKALWAKASIIYTKAYLLPADEQAMPSPTLKSINTLGPKAWTAGKVEQLLIVAGVRNEKFKSILLTYIKNLPETSARPVHGFDSGAENPDDSNRADQQSNNLAEQLTQIAPPYKERFLKMLGPVSRSTKTALTEVSHKASSTEESPSLYTEPMKVENTTLKPELASTTHITGQAYFDDIDSLFEETRTQIDKNFEKFSRADQQEDLTKKLLNTPVQEKTMSSDMKQASSAAVQQVGNYKTGLQQLQTIINTAK